MFKLRQLETELRGKDDRCQHLGRLLDDAQDNLFDTAMIVSADSDLIGPVQAVLKRYPNQAGTHSVSSQAKIS